LRATQVELYAGPEGRRARNRNPSLKLDIGAINDWLSPLFPAGFYYKTFMWPAAFLEDGLRAGNPGHGRPRARPDDA